MNIIRVTAQQLDSGHKVTTSKFIFLCGVDVSGKLVDGEWFGYFSYMESEIRKTSPFILRNGKDLVYEEGTLHATNLHIKKMEVEELFEIDPFPKLPPTSNGEKWIYQILTITSLSNV